MPALARKFPPALLRPALAAALAAFLPAAPLAAQEQAWYQVLLGGKRTGSQSETVWSEADGTRRTEVFLRMEVKRFGQSFAVTQRQTWVEGKTLQTVDAETDLNGELTTLSARFQGQDLALQERRPGGSSERVLPQVGDLLGPRALADALQAAFRAMPSLSAHELSLRQFSPETGGVHTVRLDLQGEGELSDSLGGQHRGQRVDLESSAAPGVVTEAVYDERGELEYSVTRVGIVLEVLRSGSGEAGAETTGQAADLERFEVASLSIPVRWPAALRGPGGAPRLGSLRSVTMRFTGPALPDLERAVKAERAELGGSKARDDGESLVLELALPPPAPAWPSTRQAAEEWTGDGYYLDLDDPRLEELLGECAPPGFACLERLVDRSIRNKSLLYGFAGVREVLDSRAGDCTEHALLLAALLRKHGIPARIAYGFILTEAGFIGHAWTEARADAGWFCLDPSFPGGRPYAFKLRLGIIDPTQPVWGQIGVSLLAVAGGVRAEILEADDAR